MRQMLVMGNWKLNGSQAVIDQLLSEIQDGLEAKPATAIAVCPTYVHLAQVLAKCAFNLTPIAVGAQDCRHLQSGAYTGEVAAAPLRELGGDRSAHRAFRAPPANHAESDNLLQAKLAARGGRGAEARAVRGRDPGPARKCRGQVRGGGAIAGRACRPG